jgi:hypothetical protein
VRAGHEPIVAGAEQASASITPAVR